MEPQEWAKAEKPTQGGMNTDSISNSEKTSVRSSQKRKRNRRYASCLLRGKNSIKGIDNLTEV